MLSRRDLLVTSAALPLAAQNPSRPPNIVLFLADDLGTHDLGCWGARDLQTPNIDSLSANGSRFTNWYAAAPVCAPSRASLFSGRYPIRCGVPNNGPALPPTERNIAAHLKPAGYATGLFGKWHLGNTPDTVPNAHGFDRFFGFHSGCIDFYSHRFYWGEPRTVNYHDLYRDRTEVFEDGQYSTELFTREAVRFIRDQRASPFFCCVTHNAVHYPMHAPRKYLDRFPNLPHERRTYAAMLSAMDDGVGEVLRTLRDLNLTNNTLVIFTGDNGATREARAGLDGKPATAGVNLPFRGNKFSVFDGGMHVPMLMQWPGVIPAARTVTHTGSHLDLFPTFSAAARASLPKDRTYDGFDVLAPGYRGHESLFWSINGQTAVRRANYKLVKDGKTYDGTPDGDKSLTGDDAVFLSDLTTDPGETTNLRHRYPQIADEMLTAAQQWLATVKNP